MRKRALGLSELLINDVRQGFVTNLDDAVRNRPPIWRLNQIQIGKALGRRFTLAQINYTL
jgi:hypothetical protein